MPMELQNQTEYSQLVLFVVLIKILSMLPLQQISVKNKIEVYLKSYIC